MFVSFFVKSIRCVPDRLCQILSANSLSVDSGQVSAHDHARLGLAIGGLLPIDEARSLLPENQGVHRVEALIG